MGGLGNQLQFFPFALMVIQFLIMDFHVQNNCQENNYGHILRVGCILWRFVLRRCLDPRLFNFELFMTGKLWTEKEQEEWERTYRDIIVVLHAGTGEDHGNIGQDGRQHTRDSNPKPPPLSLMHFCYTNPSTHYKLTCTL